MNIYYLGNQSLEQDSLPFKIIDSLKEKLPNINFIEFDPTENFPEQSQFVFLDTVLGIKKVTIITDINRLKTPKRVSLHDFDLSFNLKLLQKLGKITNVKIIGIPQSYSVEQAKQEVLKTIITLQNDR